MKIDGIEMKDMELYDIAFKIREELSEKELIKFIGYLAIPMQHF